MRVSLWLNLLSHSLPTYSSKDASIEHCFIVRLASDFFQFFLLFQRVEQIMSRTRQTASPNTTEESNSSAVGNVGSLKDYSKGHRQLVHMCIRYNFIANLHITET